MPFFQNPIPMRTLSLLTGLAFNIASIAGTPPSLAMTENPSSAPAAFEENKGQVRTSNGAVASFVRYRLTQGSTQLFLLENGIAYQFSRLHYPAGYLDLAAEGRLDADKQKQLDALREQVRLETFRMNMLLEGANPQARITTEGRSSDYTQYYNHDALDVHTYTKVTYHEVYPGIDWVVYTTAKGIKYDFVVRPGADPDRIRMRFEHHEELSVDADGNLIHGNRMGRFTEERPVSFQDGKEVATSFVLEGNTLRFALEDHNRNRTLTIDPARIWGTYYGGSGEDLGFSCAVDASGNAYFAGTTMSANGIASGGHQNSNGGSIDAFLVKFNSTGQRQWGTYYGGSGDESAVNAHASAIAVDGSGNVYLAGSTTAVTSIASGGHQITIGGGFDAFLVKFNSSGLRTWATYYGGTGPDIGFSCAVDGSGNVCLAGNTGSTSGIASGGHQNTYGGGTGDGFLVKFNSTGVRLWGTYYGGSAFDDLVACAADGSGNIYLTGKTNSSSSVASGGHQNTIGGLYDAILVKFNSAGVRLWATYYGGTNDDSADACAVDNSGNACIAGSTASITAIAFNGHQNAYGGGSDGLLVKFSADGTRQWGSYYGGPGTDAGYACAFDDAGNSYMAGPTTSSTAIASNGYQNTFGGSRDAMLVKFDVNGVRQWGTYYGAAGNEDGWSCTTDASGNSYLAGSTTSSDAMASGGHQNVHGGGGDAFLVKFEGDPTITTSSITGTVCSGAAVSVPFTPSGTFNAGNIFTAQLSDAGGNFSTPVDIGSLNGTTSGMIEALIPGGTTTGTGYRIRVVSSDPVVVGDDNGSNIEITTPGSPCDDGDPNTNGDMINADCMCAGEPECSTAAALQEAEPNNSNGTATPLTYATVISGTLGACSPTDNTADYFGINTTGQGVLRVEACLSTTGSTPLDVTFNVRVAGAGVLATFNLVAGANDAAITSSFEFPCQGIGNYFISVEVPGITDCMSYAFSYSMLDPVFGNDPFPTPGVAHDTYQDGQNGFYFEASSTDLFNIVPPFNGVMNIEVQAEHSGSAPGTMEVRLYSTAGIVIEEWIMPTGASGVPITTMVSVGCLGNATDYDVRFNAIDCGTSYRWKYTMAAPVFATDPEVSVTPVDYDTFQEGQLGFVGDNSDTYSTTPTLQGLMHFEIQAEHPGSAPATMEFRFQYSGVPTIVQDVPVGANSQPITTIVSVPCRGASIHTVVFEDPEVCGVSYRWRYYTTAPVFAIDAEPNNSPASAIILPEATDATGHLDFLTGVDNGGENNDHYRINLPTDGVLHVNVEAEHVGASSTEILETVIVLSTGTVLATWDAPVGANSTPTSSSFSLSCRGTTVPYYLRLISGTCGVSYRVSWNVTPAFYANDAEPNNSYSAGITMDLSDAWYDGHIGFYNTTDDDFYKFTHAGGPYSVTVSAEHTESGDGTMELAIVNSAGTVFGTFVVPVGGSSSPLTSTFTQPTLGAGALYALRLRDVTCGVSYRLHCATDADNDGVCDVADLCPGGPEPGTPCDDGNTATVDDVITEDCICEGDLTTGLNGTDAANGDLRIWPNPATDEVWMAIGEGATGNAIVIVRDLLGRTVIVLGPIAANASGLYVVQLGGMAQGTYVLDLQIGGKRWSRRIVKA